MCCCTVPPVVCMNQPGFNFLSFVSDNLGKATHWKTLVRCAGNSMYFCCDRVFHGRDSLRAVRLMTCPQNKEKNRRPWRPSSGDRVDAVEIVEAPYLGVYVRDQVYILCASAIFACMIPSSEVSLLGANTCPRWLAVWGRRGRRMDRAARFELARSFGNKQEISGSNGCVTRYLMLSRRDRRKSIPKIGSTGANRNAQSRKGFW